MLNPFGVEIPNRDVSGMVSGDVTKAMGMSGKSHKSQLLKHCPECFETRKRRIRNSGIKTEKFARQGITTDHLFKLMKKRCRLWGKRSSPGSMLQVVPDGWAPMMTLATRFNTPSSTLRGRLMRQHPTYIRRINNLNYVSPAGVAFLQSNSKPKQVMAKVLRRHQELTLVQRVERLERHVGVL